MRYYESIEDMPLWNWRKCTEGHLEFTRFNIKRGSEKQDFIIWEQLYDQYLANFGLAKDHELVLDLKMQVADLQLDYCENGQAYLLNKVKRLKREIDDILNRASGGASIDECLMYLSKWIGFKIDQKTTTVMEFNTYLKGYQSEAQALKQKSMSNG